MTSGDRRLARPMGAATEHTTSSYQGRVHHVSTDEISRRITAFIRERFLDGDEQLELEETSPLLEWGVINSMNTALLMIFIRDEFGVDVPPQDLVQRNFQDVRSIAAMVVDLMHPRPVPHQATSVGTR